MSIIIPTFNEEASIPALLASLQPLRQRGDEIVVVDGGSVDATVELARPLADRVVLSQRGRARQMNAGAAASRGEVLWFVHADSQLTPELADQLEAAVTEGGLWGRFDVRLTGNRLLLRIVAWLMNRRSCCTGVATGDQGIFVLRRVFDTVRGYPDIPLMEDIAISRALKRLQRPVCLRGPLLTSSRRWEAGGAWRTILLMWRLRLAYFAGADPHLLHRKYYDRQ